MSKIQPPPSYYDAPPRQSMKPQHGLNCSNTHVAHINICIYVYRMECKGECCLLCNVTPFKCDSCVTSYVMLCFIPIVCVPRTCNNCVCCACN